MSFYKSQADNRQYLRDVSGTPSPQKDTMVVTMTSDPGDEVHDSKKDEVRILFVDLTHLPRHSQFFILSAAVFFFYIIYSYLLELIFRLEEFRPYGWYLTLVQFGCYILFGLLEMAITGDRTRKIPLRLYMLLAFLTVATMGLSNTSVGYLNYPTQVIFKCCKLIPVMMGGVLIQSKRYSLLDVSAVLLMVVGLILFSLTDSTISPQFNSYGVFLISLALCADGAIGNFQEKYLKLYSARNAEVVFYSYFMGFAYILVGLVMSGDLVPAFSLCQKYPMKTYGYAVIFSLTGYLGLYVVLTLVKSFGALMAVTVTTCRKAVTIVLSFIFFAKPFSYQYIWSGLIVVVGIYLNVYSKNRVSVDARIAGLGSYLRQRLGQMRWKRVGSLGSTIV